MVDLGGDPIEQPVTGQRLVAKRRPLDFRGLDRDTRSYRRGLQADGPTAGWPGPTATGRPRSVRVAGETWGGANDTDGSRWVSTEVSGPDMAAIMAALAHPSISCDPGADAGREPA